MKFFFYRIYSLIIIILFIFFYLCIFIINLDKELVYFGLNDLIIPFEDIIKLFQIPFNLKNSNFFLEWYETFKLELYLLMVDKLKTDKVDITYKDVVFNDLNKKVILIKEFNLDTWNENTNEYLDLFDYKKVAFRPFKNGVLTKSVLINLFTPTPSSIKYIFNEMLIVKRGMKNYNDTLDAMKHVSGDASMLETKEFWYYLIYSLYKVRLGDFSSLKFLPSPTKAYLSNDDYIREIEFNEWYYDQNSWYNWSIEVFIDFFGKNTSYFYNLDFSNRLYIDQYENMDFVDCYESKWNDALTERDRDFKKKFEGQLTLDFFLEKEGISVAPKKKKQIRINYIKTNYESKAEEFKDIAELGTRFYSEFITRDGKKDILKGRAQARIKLKAFIEALNELNAKCSPYSVKLKQLREKELWEKELWKREMARRKAKAQTAFSSFSRSR